MPNPGTAGEAVAIQVAAIAADALEFLTGMWPAMAATSVLAMMPVTKICEVNPADPGNITSDMLLADLAGALIPSSSSASGTLGWWVWNKALYAVFQRYCQCSDTALPPNPPITVVFPPGGQYPPGESNQPQLTRIENNLTVNQNGMLTVYNGLQLATTELRDLRYRSVESIADPTNVSQTFSMSGEGSIALLPVTQGSSQEQDPFGVLVQLTAIPPTVARRGTVNQRLYGVGSLEWDGNEKPNIYPQMIVQRDALHYERQFVVAPQLVATYRLRWRLQPGVTATAYQVERAAQESIYSPTNPFGIAYQPFNNWAPPPGWQDPPFYPLPAARTFSLPPAAPP